MNKQSNIYTIIYIIVLVVVVGTALAFTAISLKPRQQNNINADKMQQILASVDIRPESKDILAAYDRFITSSFVIDEAGNKVEGEDAFDVDVAKQVKEDASSRLLPVYVCTLENGETKYILPLYGAGLWGPIWGYVSVNSDGKTIYNAYFAHQGETPGLGAEIEKPAFSNRFKGKEIIKNGTFVPVQVVKAGQRPAGNADYVDGISGGTITSKGVGAMIDNCLVPYSKFLETLNN